MFETLNMIVSVDVFTISVVGVLTAWASIMIRHMTGSTALSLAFCPAIYIGALVGINQCREFGLVFSTNNDSNIIMSACFGMIAAMLFMLVVTRMVYVLRERHVMGQVTRQGLAHRLTDA